MEWRVKQSIPSSIVIYCISRKQTIQPDTKTRTIYIQLSIRSYLYTTLWINYWSKEKVKGLFYLFCHFSPSLSVNLFAWTGTYATKFIFATARHNLRHHGCRSRYQCLVFGISVRLIKIKTQRFLGKCSFVQSYPANPDIKWKRNPKVISWANLIYPLHTTACWVN